jgi:DNA-binding GntR family transcriptional regulator
MSGERDSTAGRLEPVESAGDKVFHGVMRELEMGRLVPGQRLGETELAARFEVGRNAVREGIQRLASRGVLDVSPHRSAAIRKLDLAEAMEVLDVARELTGLVARNAAARFDVARDGAQMDEALDRLGEEASSGRSGNFSRARRQFYRLLLKIGCNRELDRIFPAVGMHIIYSQYSSPRLTDLRLSDYRAMAAAIRKGDAGAAEAAGRQHVERVRSVIREDYA